MRSAARARSAGEAAPSWSTQSPIGSSVPVAGPLPAPESQRHTSEQTAPLSSHDRRPSGASEAAGSAVRANWNLSM